MDQMPSSPSMPPAHSDMPVSHMESHMDTPHKDTQSLVKPQVMKAKRPIFLWLLVLVLLGGTGFMGYMVYTQQSSLDAFQTSLTQWTNQVATLQSSYDTSLRSMNDKLLSLETTTTTVQQNLELMKTARTAEPSPTIEPALTPEEPGIMTGTGADVISEPSEAGGTVMNESAAYESFLDQAKQGEKQTTQPDGLTLVKSRQVSPDGNLTYNVFSSKANPDDMYLYIQKANAETDFVDGWYGPFNLSTL